MCGGGDLDTRVHEDECQPLNIHMSSLYNDPSIHIVLLIVQWDLDDIQAADKRARVSAAAAVRACQPSKCMGRRLRSTAQYSELRKLPRNSLQCARSSSYTRSTWMRKRREVAMSRRAQCEQRWSSRRLGLQV